MGLNSKGPLEAASAFHGGRPEPRRTMGNPARSAFFLYAFGLASDFERLKHTKLAEELRKTIDFAANCWAGHDGKDTADAVAMVEAATQTRMNELVNDDTAN
jgi:hypothetical protein